MPRKINEYSSYGQKLITVFARLLFSGKAYSLTELSRQLDCSKQTVLRLMDDIRRSYGVEVKETVEGRQKYYRVCSPGRMVSPPDITRDELEVLLMCRAFAEHLLGSSLFTEAEHALEKNRALAGAFPGGKHFTSYRPGSIDYSAHEGSLRTLLKGLEEQRLCRLAYRPLSAERQKGYTIMPLKIFSHHDTIYVSARLKKGGERLFAVHRIVSAELLDETFEPPEDYDFERQYNEQFGIIKDEAFRVKVRMSGFAARYAAERIWSPDQEIVQKKDGIELSFTTSSRPEFIRWLLAWGDEAQVLEPAEMRKEVHQTLSRMQSCYSGDAATGI